MFLPGWSWQSPPNCAYRSDWPRRNRVAFNVHTHKAFQFSLIVASVNQRALSAVVAFSMFASDGAEGAPRGRQTKTLCAPGERDKANSAKFEDKINGKRNPFTDAAYQSPAPAPAHAPLLRSTGQHGFRAFHLSYFVSASSKHAYPQHFFKQNCFQLIENKPRRSFLIATKTHFCEMNRAPPFLLDSSHRNRTLLAHAHGAGRA
jgi:hypothetical protein